MNQVTMDWVSALRSGEHRAGVRGLLHVRGCFCATGVLGLVCGMKPIESNRGCGMVYGGFRYTFWLPNEVVESTGLSEHIVNDAAVMNDEGYDFTEIADYIERQA